MRNNAKRVQKTQNNSLIRHSSMLNINSTDFIETIRKLHRKSTRDECKKESNKQNRTSRSRSNAFSMQYSIF